MISRAKRLAERVQRTLPARLMRKFGEDNAASQAVLIAWNILGSIFPIALFLAAVLGLALSHLGVREEAIYRNVFALIPDDHSRQEFVKGVQGVKKSSGILFIVGLAGLLWTASTLFGTMEQALDLIFHAPRRTFLKQKLMSVAMMGLFSVLAAVAVLSSTFLSLLKAIPDVPPPLAQGFLAYVLQPVVGVLSGVILFGTIYLVVPNRRQRLRVIWPGALLAGMAFELLSLLFPLYVRLEHGMNQYGTAFALMFVLLAYCYFVGLITMVGAELNALLHPVPVEQPDRAMAMSPAATSSQPAPYDLGRRPRARRAPSPPGPHLGGVRRRMPLPKRALYGALGALIGLFATVRRGRIA